MDNIAEELGNINAPVLLISGEKDAASPIEEAETARDHLPNAELKIIPGAGHMLVFARKADDVNGFIETFLKDRGY